MVPVGPEKPGSRTGEGGCDGLLEAMERLTFGRMPVNP
jgi:hypothetical protein